MAEVVAWAGHPRVALVLYPDRGALRRGLARLSVFLEDPRDAGAVLPQVPSAASHPAAAYSGHNFRPRDLRRFLRQARAAGVPLEPEEARLAALLRAHGLLGPEGPDGEGEGDDPGAEGGDGEDRGCVALARGLGKAEARETLAHECMHGLFYAYPALRAACEAFWTTR